MQLPREFRMSGGFGRVALPYVAILVFFFAIMLLLGSIFAGLWGGIGIAIVATGALVGVLFAKFKKMESGTVVRFSEYGVELSDQLGFRIRLLWPDITRVGQVDTRMSGAGKIGEDGGVQVGVGSMKSQGLIGWGERVTPPNIPGWMREQLAAQPVNPADGRPEVAIPLGGIDPQWLRGPMGEWVRRYRPDLFGGQPYQTQPGYPGSSLGSPPPSYPQPGQPGTPPPGYPQAGQPGTPPGFPQAGHPGALPPGYPPAGQPQPGYPQPGYPQQGYPPPGYPPHR